MTVNFPYLPTCITVSRLTFSMASPSVVGRVSFSACVMLTCWVLGIKVKSRLNGNLALALVIDDSGSDGAQRAREDQHELATVELSQHFIGVVDDGACRAVCGHLLRSHLVISGFGACRGRRRAGLGEWWTWMLQKPAG